MKAKSVMAGAGGCIVIVPNFDGQGMQVAENPPGETRRLYGTRDACRYVAEVHLRWADSASAAGVAFCATFVSTEAVPGVRLSNLGGRVLGKGFGNMESMPGQVTEILNAVGVGDKGAAEELRRHWAYARSWLYAELKSRMNP